MELNLNSVGCIKEVYNIGNTVYQNICTGTQSVVNWGTAYWVGGIVLGLVIVAVVFLLGALIFLITRD